MKRFFSLIIFLILLMSCQKQIAKDSTNNMTGDLPAKVDTVGKTEIVKTISRNGWSYEISYVDKGIDSSIKEVFEVEKKIEEYHFKVIDKNGIVTSDIISENPNDQYTEITFDELNFQNCINISFNWNGFATSPIGYSGKKIFRIDSEGKAKMIFYYFIEAGMQDSTYVQMASITNDESSIKIKYEYYASIGSPQMGYGIFEINYDKQEGIKFVNILSEITQSAQFIDGRYDSGDPKYIIDPPKKIELTKEIINAKLSNVLKGYNFINY